MAQRWHSDWTYRAPIVRAALTACLFVLAPCLISASCADPVKELKIETCDGASPASRDDGWTAVYHGHFEQPGHQNESLSLDGGGMATFLKITILGGYESFASISRVQIN